MAEEHNIPRRMQSGFAGAAQAQARDGAAGGDAGHEMPQNDKMKYMVKKRTVVEHMYHYMTSTLEPGTYHVRTLVVKANMAANLLVANAFDGATMKPAFHNGKWYGVDDLLSDKSTKYEPATVAYYEEYARAEIEAAAAAAAAAAGGGGGGGGGRTSRAQREIMRGNATSSSLKY